MKRFMDMVKNATIKQKIIMAVVGLTTVTACTAGVVYYVNHKNSSQIEKKSGFYTDGDEVVYKDEDGEILKGFQEIDGMVYYFDEDGNRVTGEVEIDGKTYNFADDGKLILESGQTVEIENKDGKNTLNIKDEDKDAESKELEEAKQEEIENSKDKTENSSDKKEESNTSNTDKNTTTSNTSNSNATTNTSSNSSQKPSNNNNNNNNNTSSSSSSSSNTSSQTKPSTESNTTEKVEVVETEPSKEQEEKATIYKPSDVKWTATKADTSKWWVGKSEAEIKAKVTGAMVWLNEITGEVYYGIDNLKFGWNQDGIMYGGLVLLSNPYDVVLTTNFTGGRTNMLATNNFAIYWNLPEGTLDDGFSRSVDLGSFTVKKPSAKTTEQITSYYY